MNSNQPKSGMAITSLVLGILSCICFGIVTGIPAIILGHIAYSRSRKTPAEFGGAGLAIAGFVTGYASLFTTLILASMLLPALSKAKGKAQEIACINNLKQVGLGFRIWAADHDDKFPFQLGQEQGGTKELCERDAEGFEVNAAAHLQGLAMELVTPRLLVCPADTTKVPAVDFQSLTPANVSYQIRTGETVDETHPQEILARCPIHDHTLRADGSIERRSPLR